MSFRRLAAYWILVMKASIWRGLMAIGMKFHHLADPRPPRPNFKVVVPSRLSPRGGSFKLVFYVPSTYFDAPDDQRYPVVVNFHGGGFTLGTGTDDARWASSVIGQVEAVFVSVEYRLAPEYPFSVGVEDGTDAIIYLASHAEELRLDPHRIALSGFSAGGNFAFTVPLMLYELQNDVGKRNILEASQQKPRKHHHHKRPSSRQDYNHTYLHPNDSKATAASSSQLSLPRPTTTRTHSSTHSITKLSDLEPTALEIAQKIPDLTLKCIVSFYPPTDFRTTRDQKRATNPVPEKNLPPMLTNLFDTSYLPPSSSSSNNDPPIDFSDPYLSPAAAEDNLLRNAYPDDIVLYTCEYDMLNVEGVEFGTRLKSPAIGKRVYGGLVKGVPHAFDKKPNPTSFPESAGKCYSEACAELKRVFAPCEHGVGEEERRAMDQISELEVDRFEDGDVKPTLPDEEGDLIGDLPDKPLISESGDDATAAGRSRSISGSKGKGRERRQSNPAAAFKLENMI